MICQICKIRQAEGFHHIFPQYKRYRKIYGKLLDEPFNRIPACSICHLNKSIPHWNEKQFRNAAEFRGHELPVGTKSFRLQELRDIPGIKEYGENQGIKKNVNITYDDGTNR